MVSAGWSTQWTRRVEDAVRGALAPATEGAPPKLAAALEHALFPGGARMRPKLVLVAALASGDADPRAADAAAGAVELLHAASLVHDDLPCFDDAETRRGRPSVHKAFGEPLAVLAGDALIVRAFEVLFELGQGERSRLAASLGSLLARAAGAPRGLVAGQALEAEPAVNVAEYHRAKTATLFEAAAAMGALAGGGDPACWRSFGELVGRAYQVADDLADARSSEEQMGKPVGRDVALGRPSYVLSIGVEGAERELRRLLAAARDAVPQPAARELVTAWTRECAGRLGL